MKFLTWLKEKIAGNEEDPWQEDLDISQRQEELQKLKLTSDLEANIKKIEQITGNSADIKIRRFQVGKKVPAALIYIDGMTDTRAVEEILRAMMLEEIDQGEAKTNKISQTAVENLLVVDDVQEVEDILTLFDGMASGMTGLLLASTDQALLCETQGEELRSISEPDAENTIRGPRDGFIENLRTNTSLIRRRIRVPHLWIESMEIGDLTRTKVELAYIKGLASEEIITEVRDRLQKIDIDGILESGYLEEFLEDTPFTPFPLLLRTERTDKVAAGLLEGRVAIFTAETPHVLILPAELPMMMQAPDDYFEKFPIGFLTRILRMTALLFSLLLPAIYVAVVNFHQELFPTALLLRIASAREGVPFPVIFELLLLEFLFEILREAGIRLPSTIGQAVSIVGALILGDAAIRAGLVSPAVVVVVAMTAIASFSAPVFSLSITMRILRFGFTLLAAAFGFFGVQFGLFLLIIHMCALRSFGVPYLTPVAPFILSDMKDNVIRYWWWGQRTRPKMTGRREPVRQDPDQRPRVEEQEIGPEEEE